VQGRPNRSAKVDAGISRRLGLEVDDRNRRICSTTSKLSLPKELPSIEEALQMLAGALKAACEPGLDKVEVQRFPGFRV